MTGHEVYHRSGQSISVYEYDTADNGPECEVITRILAQHPLYVPGTENQSIVDDRLRLIQRYGRRPF